MKYMSYAADKKTTTKKPGDQASESIKIVAKSIVKIS